LSILLLPVGVVVDQGFREAAGLEVLELQHHFQLPPQLHTQLLLGLVGLVGLVGLALME
jgi:hypothetical protein